MRRRREVPAFVVQKPGDAYSSRSEVERAWTGSQLCIHYQHPLLLTRLPQERGYSGIELERVQDSWVRNVRVVNVDNGFLVSNSNRVTLQVRSCIVPAAVFFGCAWGAAPGCRMLTESRCRPVAPSFPTPAAALLCVHRTCSVALDSGVRDAKTQTGSSCTLANPGRTINAALIPFSMPPLTGHRGCCDQGPAGQRKRRSLGRPLGRAPGCVAKRLGVQVTICAASQSPHAFCTPLWLASEPMAARLPHPAAHDTCCSARCRPMRFRLLH